MNEGNKRKTREEESGGRIEVEYLTGSAGKTEGKRIVVREVEEDVWEDDKERAVLE